MQFIASLFSGTMGRWDFFKHFLGTFFGFLILLGMFVSFFPGVINERTSLAFSSIIAGAYFISICIRRIHDLDRSEMLLILLFIPGVNVLFLLYLLLFKGKPQDAPTESHTNSEEV